MYEHRLTPDGPRLRIEFTNTKGLNLHMLAHFLEQYCGGDPYGLGHLDEIIGQLEGAYRNGTPAGHHVNDVILKVNAANQQVTIVYEFQPREIHKHTLMMPLADCIQVMRQWLETTRRYYEGRQAYAKRD